MNPTVFYEDNDVIAVDKPEGILSVAAADDSGLPGILKARFGGRLFVVHRLDREVSGVLLFAKNRAAHRHLNDEFARRTVRKTYLALSHGTFASDRGTIRLPIREFGSGRMGVDREKGKPSTTEYEVAERLGNHTLVRIYPLTGRRHQIRVHLYSLGHPVAGDMKYGRQADQSVFPRLMLHASEIRIRIPSGKDIRIEAPVPESFSSVLMGLHKKSAL